MKIALVSPYDFAFPGGVPNHITALERQFTKMGHDVRIIAPASKRVPDFGDRFIPIGKPRPIPINGSIARVTISMHLAPKIKDVLAKEHFDIIHLHEPFLPMLCSAVLRFAKTPMVGTFHACGGTGGSLLGYRIGWPVSAIMIKRRVPKLKGRIAVSLAAQRFASKTIHGDYDIIPNGIELDRFSPDVKPFPEYMDGKKNILFVGRLESRKGVIYLLRAYWRIKREIPESRLMIVGPGKNLLLRFQRWVARRKMKDVVFVGYASQDELPRYYKTADIFCSPATGRESFGIVLLEAMAMGKPIVATNIEGYRCVITNGVEGILVPPKDDRRLAGALKILINNPELCREMSRNGLEKVKDYSWEKVARRILSIYNRVIDESHTPRNSILEPVTSGRKQ
ncbi:MAG: glycosyltransferase family 4 protein [Dehalococcoidales bacterium]|nr:glycosyltransferase family 4 protein [Dehalococcoidales bacterium]